MAKKRVAILISGRGTNMAALIDATAEAGHPAEIVGVISDQPSAAGLALAAQRGLPVQAVQRSGKSAAANLQAV